MANFNVGQLYGTPGAMAHLEKNKVNYFLLFGRHISCDWGDLDEQDKQANEDALKNGGRLFSAYQVADETVYVITEADRSCTTMLLADEY
ncbi:MAG: hypothetical protein V5B36_00975 [Candidatus Accumulibacter sp. UW25]